MEIIYYLLIFAFSAAIIYNISKYVDLLYKAYITKANITAMIITVGIISVIIVQNNFNLSYIIFGVLIILYTISGMIVKGFNRTGITTTGTFTFLAKYIKWKDVKAMDITYLKDGYVDLTITDNNRAFNHRYKEELDVVLLKIKKELKL
ncbi:hypothetical protein ACWOAQ_08835 [Helcococcus kunzii]|uniref:DUF5673 domain-containing protein n=1 Tax=Helcococcus kunzii ATCC 51366 TaxID=883114 RepID=H3NQ02_9FIRM|nr:hypothetical protein [Helcococcus kunzii]EHR32682.1 hypothetical protein HMPREF9709_01413 [Helcococcus kunzii ATCC 51366]MCT1796023.1 hypothetical protein [Helcococcus kunzii]MCT1988201.1 hypothetical protein [Helcococcus kunzii]